ncbi:Asp-tRNA(Asn)/Glu-tRNA(Gln) amidotransferase subunit GatC [Hydromonas duriensis]|uniref:Aspartyl/glutamyl-tRNA(Asn/Gln) amidotransferase subunit C n=1 Tax=Hydromonas duriensis TaxID=1527608 RepID=A0A4R6Y7R6_9BURK|nr:Asp-tRNA(Asn)/Glu-tRNA(Gln) amidotransferase subunit GatC [Hydromonas duriensis]TDR31391.1 aspartyl/glutamyl-tRNA(Asn/Gln) amidotransferase subunit C [Hydromonas duriensis]
MALTLDDVRKVARLAQLELNASEEAQTLTHLDNIFKLIDHMGSVDTTGVAPLNHPISMIQEVSQRLREDKVTEDNHRDANMANAPQKSDGLFLVPKVIE